MKKFLTALALLVGLIATPALAANCASYPFTLTNGQTADANQVMANFNSILGCGNNSLAHNGANSDITSLNGLTTPLSILQGGTGNTSGTAANATLATSATKLATGRTIGITGDLTYTSPSFDGTSNVTAAGTLATVNANVGSFTSANITVNAKGLITAAANGAGGVTSVFSRTGAVTATSGDYTVSQVTGAAPLASPALTGSPTINGVAPVITTDARFGGVLQNAQCTYGLVLTDAGKQTYCNTGGAHTLTIPANGSVAFPVGTKIDVVNDCSAGNLTIAITSDTLVWFTPGGGAGSRTLAACGEATLSKVTSTRWAITGTGLS